MRFIDKSGDIFNAMFENNNIFVCIDIHIGMSIIYVKKKEGRYYEYFGEENYGPEVHIYIKSKKKE